MTTKISIYPSEQQKEKLVQFAKSENLSLSQYLLKRGLQESIQSNRIMAMFASVACQLYALESEVENSTDRLAIHTIGEKIYGIFEDSASK